MKGLLLKEFHVWVRTRSWIMLYLLAMTVFACFTTSRLSVVSLGILVGQISNAFLLDEKCGWLNYSKALPFTPFQRVTAKYIVTGAELFFGISAYIISSFVSQKYHYSVSNIYFTPPSPMKIYSETCIIVAFSVLFLAIMLPVCFRFKGSKRMAISLIPSVAYILTVVTGLNVFDNGAWNILINNLKWLPAAIAFIGFVFLGTSWMISVIIETNSDSDYKKKFKKAAIVLVTFAVIPSIIISATAIKTNSTQEIKTEQTYDAGYSMLRDIEEITNDYNNLYADFCNEFHIGMTVEECAGRFAGMGYFQNQTNPEKFYSESGKINANLTTDKDTGRIESTYIYCYLVEEKKYESATIELFDNIKSNFYEGMTEDKLHLTFNQLEIFPCEIYEKVFFDNELRRYYTLKFVTDKFNGDSDKSVMYALSIGTDGETVIDIDETMFNRFDDTSETTETTETPLEVANREVTAFLKEFCNANRLKGTPRECTKHLRKMGYTESEETDDLYHSENGKVSVSLVTDENDELEKITVIPNYGEMKYIESATDEDLNKLTADFTNGMTESQFIEKLIKIDMLPDIITEEYGEGDKHTRIYEFRYRIGDYNGDGALTYSITVDVIDGKVDYISAS